jgi:hypothetical protein
VRSNKCQAGQVPAAEPPGRTCQTNPIPGRQNGRPRGASLEPRPSGLQSPAFAGRVVQTKPIALKRPGMGAGGQGCAARPESDCAKRSQLGGSAGTRRDEMCKNEPTLRRHREPIVPLFHHSSIPIRCRSCQTKPIGEGVSSLKSQVSRWARSWSGLPTSCFALPTRPKAVRTNEANSGWRADAWDRESVTARHLPPSLCDYILWRLLSICHAERSEASGHRTEQTPIIVLGPDPSLPLRITEGCRTDPTRLTRPPLAGQGINC